MKKQGWKRKIKKACVMAGTYQPFFDPVIDALAGIMEMRDDAAEQFQEWGGQTVIEHTNNKGQSNKVKNPALVVLMDCNAEALAYWRELGLTSKSYKQMTGSLDIREESRTLEDVLNDLGV